MAKRAQRRISVFPGYVSLVLKIGDSNRALKALDSILTNEELDYILDMDQVQSINLLVNKLKSVNDTGRRLINKQSAYMKGDSI